MNRDSLDLLLAIADILLKTAVPVIGGLWALFKLREYRELKQRIQLDIDAHLYELSSAENVAAFTWDEDGNRVATPVQAHTHAVEVLLKFNNKGLIRLRLYNIQIGINTMRPPNEAQFDGNDGRLKLTRIFTSGNIVPIETLFYYIEPGVEQTIHFLTLIPEPRELIQIHAKFSLEQERIFPKKDVGTMGLRPHTAARTYQIDAKGLLVKEDQVSM